ncbi:MAG TPA: hypothetical protein VMR20_10020, partial [Verrucomicrobiae bacterium]|nr:hypothetical protein [Verrucomicrobiae bacterium]
TRGVGNNRSTVQKFNRRWRAYSMSEFFFLAPTIEPMNGLTIFDSDPWRPLRALRGTSFRISDFPVSRLQSSVAPVIWR